MVVKMKIALLIFIVIIAFTTISYVYAHENSREYSNDGSWHKQMNVGMHENNKQHNIHTFRQRPMNGNGMMMSHHKMMRGGH